MNETAGPALPQEDHTGSRLGMWLFLLSEILLFGGLFLLYAAYRYRYAADFHEASRGMEVVLGTVNTLLLQASALSVTLAVLAVRRGKKDRAAFLLGATIVLGLIFLGIKGSEWWAKIAQGIYPRSPALLARPKGEILFFGLYFTMTGLHGLHVLIGLGVLAVMTVLLMRGKIGASRSAPLENGGLYWHLVDIVWMFLYPLFYLIT